MPMHYPHVTLPQGVVPSEVIDVSTVIGPFFLAQLFNWALFGILCLQVYIYWLRFPKDMTYIKLLVYTIFSLDIFFMATTTHSGWAVLVANWGDINILDSLPWTWAMVPVNSGVVSCLVQLFFAWRIWKLSKSWYMPALIAIITLTQCAFAINTGVIAYNVRTFHYIRDLMPGVWLVGSIVADILISATLVRILWNSQTGFKDTDGVVMRLIRLTIEAAAVPSIAAACKVGLIYGRHANEHLIFCVVLGRIYSNVLLTMLNCRDPLFGGGSKPDTMAGAARLSEPTTVMSFIKSKFSLGHSSRSSQGRGSVSYGFGSHEQFASLDRAYGGEKYGARMSRMNSTARPAGDLEAGRGVSAHGIQFPRRGSNDRDSQYSLTDFDARSRLSSVHGKSIEEEQDFDQTPMPLSPNSADLKTTSQLLPRSPQAISFVVPPMPPTAASRPSADRRDTSEVRR